MASRSSPSPAGLSSQDLDAGVLDMVREDPEVTEDPMAEHLGVGKSAGVSAIRRLRIEESLSKKGQSRDRLILSDRPGS